MVSFNLIMFFNFTINILNMFLAIGVWQVVIIAFVILLLFGGSRLPKLMKGLGTGLKEFKDATKDDDKDDKPKG